MQRTITTIMTALLCVASALAGETCMLKPMSEQEVRASASAVVEGRVVSTRTEWLDGSIVTIWTFQIERLQQGVIGTPAIDIATQGGTIGMMHLRAIPSEGPLMKNARVIAVEPWKGLYRVACGPQGILRSEERREKRTSTSHTQAAITSVTPLTVTAGTNTAITITGTGFGDHVGQARVRYRDVDQPGTAWIDAPANHVRSWNDTEIIVWVPSTIDGVARSGEVQVVTDVGATITSGEEITVLYAHLTVENTAGNIGVFTRPELHNDNGMGGFTLTMNQDLAAAPAVVNTVRRALSRWRCKTGLNVALAAVNTADQCQAPNQFNLISWDNAGCQLQNGVLGVTYLWFQGCLANGVQSWRLAQMDVILDGATDWNVGPDQPGAGEYDLESVLVHELGHAALLEHDVNATSVMQPALAAATSRRVPDEPHDVDAVQDIVMRSATALPCGVTGGMGPLGAQQCNIAPPVAAFRADPSTGCYPLFVQFRSQSEFEPDTYEWDVNNDGTWDYFTSDPAHTYTAAGSYTVVLRVTNEFGMDVTTKQNAVIVSAPPIANAGTDAQICRGTNVQIGALVPATGGLAPYTYAWSPKSGLSDSSVARPMARPTQTTTYTLTVTDARGCTATDNVVVVVFQPPVVTGASDVTACRGTSTQLRPTVSGGLPPYAYAWSPATGLTDPATLQPVAQPANTTTYILTVTDARGCMSYDTVVYTVQQPPGLMMDEARQICTGGSVKLDPLISSGPEHGTILYRWSPAEGLSDAFIRDPVASPNITTTYILVVGDSRGCSVADSVTVTVVPQLQPTITSATGFTACDGDVVTLDAGGGYTHYRWSTGDTTRMITVTQARRVNVEVSAGSNCTGASDTVSVEFLPRPAAVVQGALSACQDSTQTYKVSAANAKTYTWNVTGGTVLNGANSETVTVRWTTDGQGALTCAVTSENDCVDTSDAIEVTVTPTPARPTIQKEESTLTSSSAATYQWLRDGAEIAGARDRSLTVTKNGRYSVRIQDAAACSNVSDPLDVIVSSLQEADADSPSFTVTPQPALDDLRVTWQPSLAVHTLELLSLTGQVLVHANAEHGSTMKGINTSELATGEYVLVLRGKHSVRGGVVRIVR